MDLLKYKNIYRYFGLIVIFSIYVFCSKSPVDIEELERHQIKVFGIIDTDTVWESGKDYLVCGQLTVEENVLLNIQPDVRIILSEDSAGNRGKLYVKGGINADGKDLNTPILFYSGDGNSWGMDIYVGSPPSNFIFCNFEHLLYGINVTQCALNVNNCSFNYCKSGVIINKSDSVSIKNSDFIDNDIGIKLELSRGISDSSISISRNNFNKCNEVAIEITNGSSAIIFDNIFHNCYDGIYSKYNSNVYIVYNDFKIINNGVEFWEAPNGIVRRNNFSGGQIFININLYSNPSINKNNFLNCNDYKIKLFYKDPSARIDAINNWWDTTNKTDIENFVFDGNDVTADDRSGVVEIEPFELNLVTECGVRNN